MFMTPRLAIFSVLFSAAALLLLTPVDNAAAQAFDWQRPQAKVLATGDLEWAPEPFRLEAGASVRYIDFETGSDQAPGTKAAPWKHHPWDPAADGQARSTRGAHTYVFKRGVIYRGRLVPQDDRGEAGNPIRLTSDPSWGHGDAVIQGSEALGGWKRRAHSRMPDAEKVWATEVDYLPRTMWMVDAAGLVTRLRLARTPNWSETDRNDVLSEWPVWENPDWWKNDTNYYNYRVGDKDRHLGIDTRNLTGPAADYLGATVWTEWGFVMGSPYPARVEGFDEKQRGVAFRGPWTFDKQEKITKGNRYFLENKPQWLDEPGEFWVERLGTRARIYLRLPDDADPNTVRVEAGRHIHIVDARQLHHVQFSGLTFRFANIHWDYNNPSWSHPDLKTAVIRLNGSGDGIDIRNCTFEHVHMPVRIAPGGVGDRLGTIRITDNIMRHTDHGAITIDSKFGDARDPRSANPQRVEVLRNHISDIGWRVLSGEHGHAVSVAFATTSHIAGNVLHRIAGSGIFVFGGKQDGRRGPEAPLSRHLIHANRVEDALLRSDDWGGIETWQGGPFYVFNNVVINPVGFKNWTLNPDDTSSVGSFGHAYYLDGSFKTYLFNNIAAGRNNTLGTKGVNTTGLQNVIGFDNTFFHNSVFRFADLTSAQEPSASRLRYMSNIFQDSSRLALRNADPKEAPPDPNAAHYKQGSAFAYPTLAYTRNLFADIRGKFGVFEETGAVYDQLQPLADALKRLHAVSSDVGVMGHVSALADPAKGDFRPARNGGASRLGSRVFVPWALSGVVGEWHFIKNEAEPTDIVDDHWHMTSGYNDRAGYKHARRYPLAGNGIVAASFVDGPLEDWARGALSLDGKTQHLVLHHDQLGLPAPAATKPEPVTATTTAPFGTVKHPLTISPGEPFEITVDLTDPAEAKRVQAHLHWLKTDGFGGWMHSGSIKNAGRSGQGITFSLDPSAPGGLHKYSLFVFLDPGQGVSLDATPKIAIAIEVGDNKLIKDLSPRTLDIEQGNMLIETVIQTRASQGWIAGKLATTAGYALDIVDGRPRLRLRAGGAEVSATAATSIADGGWHHVIAEVDRRTGPAIYIDGKRVETVIAGRLPGGSLSNTADFLVGGGPERAMLAGALDFLRISRGTLADARTTIEELYAWEFDGPHLRDFAGASRLEGNAAGALVTPP